MKLSSQLPPLNLAAKPKQATQLKFFFLQLTGNAGAGPKGATPAPAKKGRLRNPGRKRGHKMVERPKGASLRTEGVHNRFKGGHETEMVTEGHVKVKGGHKRVEGGHKRVQEGSKKGKRGS